MFSVKSLILCVFLWISSAYCGSGLDKCAFKNVDYNAVIAGIDGEVESSDPIFIEKLEATLPDGEYVLTNVKITGMKDCKVTHVKCEGDKFECVIECPHLVNTYDFVAAGNLKDVSIAGQATQRNDLVDYVMTFEGKYETVIGHDRVPRPVVKDYTLKTNPRGIVKFNIKYPHSHEKEKEDALNKHVNEHWRETEKVLKSPAIDTLMDIFINNFNAYTKYH